MNSSLSSCISNYPRGFIEMPGKISSISIYGRNFNAWIDKDGKGGEDIQVYTHDFRLVFPELKNTAFYSYFYDKKLTKCDPHQRKCYNKKNNYLSQKMSLVSLKVAKRAFKHFKYNYKPRENTSQKQLKQPETKAILPPPEKLSSAKSVVVQPNQSTSKHYNFRHKQLKKPKPPPHPDIPKPLTISPPSSPKSNYTIDEIYEWQDKALKCCRENIENLMRCIL